MSWDHRLKARKKAAVAAVQHNGLALELTPEPLKGDIDGNIASRIKDISYLHFEPSRVAYSN